MMEKNTQTKSWFLGKINKIDKLSETDEKRRAD